MSKRIMTVAAFVLVAIAACDTNQSGGLETSDLVADLAIEPNHFHIWETTGEFTVTVIDPDDNVITEFEDIRVQVRLEGEDTWESIELTQDGDFFVGQHVFGESGNYAVRVVAMRAGDSELVPIYNAPELLEVVRAHQTEGGYTVSFEAFPAHIHEGDGAAMTFWFEDDAGAPVTGLSPTVLIGDLGSVATYPAVENGTEPGRYSAEHMFQEGDAGDFEVGVEYMGTDAMTHTFMIAIEIHEAH